MTLIYNSEALKESMRDCSKEKIAWLFLEGVVGFLQKLSCIVPINDDSSVHIVLNFVWCLAGYEVPERQIVHYV